MELSHQLALCPLGFCSSSGNQIVIKPSELTPNTSSIIAKSFCKTFHEDHVKVEGGIEVSRFTSSDGTISFFTGSIPVREK
jgi:aldehyde dehydrogenase (NAD+)